jgi:hypothetical protein
MSDFYLAGIKYSKRDACSLNFKLIPGESYMERDFNIRLLTTVKLWI